MLVNKNERNNIVIPVTRENCQEKILSLIRIGYIPITIIAFPTNIADAELNKQYKGDQKILRNRDFSQLIHSRVDNKIFNYAEYFTPVWVDNTLKKVPVPISIRNTKILNQLNKYLKSHYSKSNICVKDMADHVYLSVKCFQDKIKKMTGITPIQLLNHYRVHQAEIELVYRNERMIDIALNNGFSNYSTFYKSFKAYYGINPTIYRARFKKW